MLSVCFPPFKMLVTRRICPGPFRSLSPREHTRVCMRFVPFLSNRCRFRREQREMCRHLTANPARSILSNSLSLSLCLLTACLLVPLSLPSQSLGLRPAAPPSLGLLLGIRAPRSCPWAVATPAPGDCDTAPSSSGSAQYLRLHADPFSWPCLLSHPGSFFLLHQGPRSSQGLWDSSPQICT